MLHEERGRVRELRRLFERGVDGRAKENPGVGTRLGGRNLVAM